MSCAPSFRVPILGSGSDFAPFIDQQGVTCIDISYKYDPSMGISNYPLYHSVYETVHLMNEIIDPTFTVSILCNEILSVWGIASH